MTLKAIDSANEYFQVGDVVVQNGYGAPYGVKLVKKIYLEATNEYHFIAEEGDVTNGKWKPAKSGGTTMLSIHTVKNLRGYQSKWTPGEQFKSGEVLKDQDGVLFLVAGDKVWNLSKGTQTTQAKWEASGTSYGARVFTRVKTASGDSFNTVVKVEDVKTSW